MSLCARCVSDWAHAESAIFENTLLMKYIDVHSLLEQSMLIIDPITMTGGIQWHKVNICAIQCPVRVQ